MGSVNISNLTSTSNAANLGQGPKLGVGLLFNPALPEFVKTNQDVIDYVEIIPDMFQTDLGLGQSPRFIELESWVDVLESTLLQYPLIAHNIGLSLGTPGSLDEEYVERIAKWLDKCHFLWHSDHLSFAQVRGPNAHDHNAGLAVPVPYDHEVLDMIASNIRTVQRLVPCPFIIENNVYYVDFPEQEMSEAEFLNALTKETGCGILLDIHNLYANARNHNFSSSEFLDQLDLASVIEVHIAGGNEFAGMYTDSHSGPCPEPVWDLLELLLPRAPNLRAITFEFHESYYPVLKADGIRGELGRARDIWRNTHP